MLVMWPCGIWWWLAAHLAIRPPYVRHPAIRGLTEFRPHLVMAAIGDPNEFRTIFKQIILRRLFATSANLFLLHIHLVLGPKGVELRLMVHQNTVSSRSRVSSIVNLRFTNAVSASLTT